LFSLIKENLGMIFGYAFPYMCKYNEMVEKKLLFGPLPIFV